MSHASGGPDDPSAPTPEDWEQTRVDPVTFAPPTGEPYGTPQFVWPDQQAWAPPSEPWAPPGPGTWPSSARPWGSSPR